MNKEMGLKVIIDRDPWDDCQEELKEFNENAELVRMSKDDGTFSFLAQPIQDTLEQFVADIIPPTLYTYTREQLSGFESRGLAFLRDVHENPIDRFIEKVNKPLTSGKKELVQV